MAYRRIPVQRRPYYTSGKQYETSAGSLPDSSNYSIPEEDRIPLPTEEESIPLPGGQLAVQKRRKSFFDILPFKMGIEELLLIGLIFILFREGIDDDILILLLFYILFTGFEKF